MGLEIFRRNLRDRKRALIGWTIGLVALVVLSVAFWPSIKGNSSYDDLIKDMPEALKAFVGEQPLTTPEGYLESQFFLYLVPLLFMIYGLGRAADAIAGEEERNTMDLLLSTPVTRRRVVGEKALAMVVGVGILATFFLSSLYASAQVFAMDIGFDKLAAATLGSMLLALAFSFLALAVSAWRGSKGQAIAAAAATATAAFFLNSLAPLADGLEGYQKLSPFHWFLRSSPLVNGVDFVGFGALAIWSLALFALAMWAFDRRDVAP